MKTLYLLRHAKSSWDDPELADFDRPLNKRGLEAARLIGTVMSDRGIRPQAMISSPAKRTKQTAVLVREWSESQAPIIFDDRIYEASALSLFHLIGEFDPKYEAVILIGHNPGMEEIIRLLTGELHEVPTAALSEIALDIDAWSELAVNCGRLNFIFRPKDILPR